MSFDKNYPNRKDHRKAFYNAKSFDRTCRNHGSCAYCLESRMHKHKKRDLPIDELDVPWCNGNTPHFD